MSTSIEPFVAVNESAEPENLGLLHLAVERKHERPAVLRYRMATGWQDMPDWRFHRHAMRIGLYLRERAQLDRRRSGRAGVRAPSRMGGDSVGRADWGSCDRGRRSGSPRCGAVGAAGRPRPSRRLRRGKLRHRVVACQPAARGGRARSSLSTLSMGGSRPSRCSRGPKRSISEEASIRQSGRTPRAHEREPCRPTPPRWATRWGPTGAWRGASFRIERWSAACTGCGRGRESQEETWPT